MVTIHVVAWNEELMLPFLIKFYRERFTDPIIIIHDNGSTDSTVALAQALGCQVLPFDSGGELNDQVYLDIKNNCWKQDTTDWSLICDADECLDITERQLQMEELNGVSIIRTAGWNMVGVLGTPFHMIGKVHAPQYAKKYLFNNKSVRDINYAAGCHTCKPTSNEGPLNFSLLPYDAYHFKALSEDYVVNRHKAYVQRMSQINRKHNWGYHYFDSEEKIRLSHKIAVTTCTPL